jgi:hypothetical protein
MREKKENIPTTGTETTKIGRKRTRNLEARRKKEIDAYRRAVLHPTFSQQEELCSKKKRKRNCPHRALQNDYTFEAHDEKKFRPAEKEQ